jgi:Potassium-transporting ATPase A subunit
MINVVPAAGCRVLDATGPPCSDRGAPATAVFAACSVTYFLPLRPSRSPRCHHGRSDDLAMADLLAPASAGMFPADKPTFAGLLAGSAFAVGALMVFPAVPLGPLVEYLSHGRFF